MNVELETLKIRLGIEGTEQDGALEELLSTCMEEAQLYTRQTAETKLYTVVRLMAEERYHKCGGVLSANYSGISETYESDYSAHTIKALNRLRLLKVV